MSKQTKKERDAEQHANGKAVFNIIMAWILLLLVTIGGEA